MVWMRTQSGCCDFCFSTSVARLIYSSPTGPRTRTMKSVFASAVVLLAGLVSGQQTAYGQCGGSGWTGATTCESGWQCVVNNSYYSQCVPATSGAAPAPTTSATSAHSSKATSTTLSKVVTSTSKVVTSTAPASTGTFAKTDGVLFNIDGTTTYYAGTNCYWCGFLTANGDVDFVMGNMASAGLKIVRVWGFNDVNTIPSAGTVWFQYLAESGSKINTGADGLERLDYVVQSAEAHGLKVIINFVNNWTAYGGMAAYVSAFGGNTSTWYTNTQAQSQYQTYIEAVVSRYKDSTAVFAWELANEPRCAGCDP